jgi:carbon-monoxide dehydrogenase medium subunit
VEGGTLHEIRLVFFGVGAAPVRARSAERALAGGAADAAAIAAARRALAAELDPPGDVHGSPALRRHLAGVLLSRVIPQLREARS